MSSDLVARYKRMIKSLPSDATGLHALGLALREDFQCDRTTLYLQATHGTYISIYAEGLEEMILAVKPGEGVVGKVIATRSPYVSNDALYDPNSLSRLRDHYSGYITHSLLAAPIPGLLSRPHGVIQLVNKINLPFDTVDMDRLVAIAPVLRGIRKFCRRPATNLWQQSLHKEPSHAVPPA
jgi:signal transduction protein with GAF and PtsI domain